MLVSVCLITYNHQDYIKDCIEGIFKQKINFNIEIIIGDDASSDNTLIICEELSKNQSNISFKIFQNETNLGMIKNFIKSMNECSGKYIAYCEGDDYWTDPCKLQKQVDFLERNPEYSMVFHDVSVKGRVFQEYYLGGSESTFTVTDLARGDVSIPMLSLVFRNYDLDFPRYFHTLKIGDFPLQVMLAEHGNIKYIPEVMGVRRVHDEGVWSSMNEEKKLNAMLVTLYLMIGNHREDVNWALIEHHLTLIARSLSSGLKPGLYPPEMMQVARKLESYGKIRKMLKKTGFLGVLKNFKTKS